MKAILFLADAGSLNGDGTFSTLRAGINQLAVETFDQTNFLGALLFIWKPTPNMHGDHKINIDCVDFEGKSNSVRFEGKIHIKEWKDSDPEPVVTLPIPVHVQFKRAGAYTFVLHIDDVECDRLKIGVSMKNQEVKS